MLLLTDIKADMMQSICDATSFVPWTTLCLESEQCLIIMKQTLDNVTLQDEQRVMLDMKESSY